MERVILHEHMALKGQGTAACWAFVAERAISNSSSTRRLDAVADLDVVRTVALNFIVMFISIQKS